MVYRTPALSFAIAITALLAVAAPAPAGTYHVQACDAADGFTNNSWRYETNEPMIMESQVTCPSAGDYSGLVATTNLQRPTPPLQGTYAAWVVRAPAGTVITRARLKRWLGMEAGTGWEVYGRGDDGTILAGGNLHGSVGPG